MERIVIIGAGECGVRAAFALREQGFSGSVTLIGDERSLPYERPPLSKGTDSALKLIRSEAAYAEGGINLRRATRVTRIDRAARTVLLHSAEGVPYDALLIATGSRARLFPTLNGCLTLRTESDANAIFRSVKPGLAIGIIGGGFIGLELAAVARVMGAEVTVFEAGERLLARAVPAELASMVADRHRAEGVTIRTDVNVASATATTVVLSDGETLSFDQVVAGVGSVPNTELAEAAGLEVENGIQVDCNFRTSDRQISAAGDCCNFVWQGARVRLESWKAAQDQGVFAAAAMLSDMGSYGNVPWFWSDQYDLTLQVAGLFDPALAVTERPADDGQRIVFQCDAEDRLLAAAGIGPGNSIAKDIRIFEKLIERAAPLDPGLLADPSQNIKRLLRAA